MSKPCCYCGLRRKLSREHIWPAGFLRRGNFGLKFSLRAGHSFKGDLTIRDVCHVCNNGSLSSLDGYACKLYDSNFGQFPKHYEPVRFAFEYSLLTRWLLKISFNSARSTGNDDVELLTRYRDAILAEGDNCPLNANFYVALIGPGRLDFPDGRPAKTIEPHAARCGPIIIPGVDGHQHVSTRMVMINAYFFTLVLSRTPTMPIDEIFDPMRRIPGEPLARRGGMQLTTTMSANEALMGISDWPKPKETR